MNTFMHVCIYVFCIYLNFCLSVCMYVCMMCTYVQYMYSIYVCVYVLTKPYERTILQYALVYANLTLW